MRRPAHAVTVDIEIPFHDCDPLAVVWHGRYFEYLEAARRKLFEDHRIGVFDMIELKLRMFVSDARCRYNFPLRYGDQCSIRCWFSEIGPILRVSYDVLNVTHGRPAARAYTCLAITDDVGNLLSELPVELGMRLPKGASEQSGES